MCGTQRAIKTYQIVSALQKFTMQGKAWLFNYVSNGSGLLVLLLLSIFGGFNFLSGKVRELSWY